MNRLGWLLLILLLVSAGVSQAQEHGPGSEAKVAKLMQTWDNYRQSLPVLRYRYTQNRTFHANPAQQAIPKDLKSSEERELTMEWKSGRLREIMIHPRSIGKPELQRSTSAFDRTKIYGIREPLLASQAPDPTEPPTGGTTEGHLTSYKAKELGAQPPMVSVGHLPIGAIHDKYSAGMFPPDPREMLYFSRVEKVAGVPCDV